jgi:hypothetical protein
MNAVQVVGALLILSTVSTAFLCAILSGVSRDEHLADLDVEATDDWHCADVEARIDQALGIVAEPLWDAAELAALRAQCAADGVAARRVGGGR